MAGLQYPVLMPLQRCAVSLSMCGSFLRWPSGCCPPGLSGLLHDDDLAGLDQILQVFLEVVGDVALGLQFPDAAVSLEEADPLVGVDAQQELALGLRHLEEGAERLELDAGLDLDESVEGDALTGLHGLRDAVVLGGDAVLVGHPAQQVEQVGRALVGDEQAAQLDQCDLAAAKTCAQARDVSLGAVEDIAGEVRQVGGHDLDALVALSLHHDDGIDLGELGADQLADAIEAADADAVGPVDVGRDPGEGCVGVGLAGDLEGFGLLQGDDFVDHFCEHCVVLLFLVGSLYEFQDLGGLLLSAVHVNLAGDLRHHFGHDHFAVAVAGDAEGRCDRVGGRERCLGLHGHGDRLALVIRRQLDGEGDLPLGCCLGVEVEDVVDDSAHLVVDALLKRAAGHLQDARPIDVLVHVVLPPLCCCI